MARAIVPAKYVLSEDGETGTLTLRGVSADRVNGAVQAAFDKPVKLSTSALVGQSPDTPQA